MKIRSMVVAAITLTASVVAVTPAQADTAGALTGLAGKCADLPGGNATNGTPIQLYARNTRPHQYWTIGSDGTIRTLGKCLDVAGGSNIDGTKVQIWDCGSGNTTSNGRTAQRPTSW